MRKVGSKILSWILTVVIVLGLMPMNTYAAETADGHSNHKVCVNAEGHGGDGKCTHDTITDWQELNEELLESCDNTLTSGNYYLTQNTGNVILLL